MTYQQKYLKYKKKYLELKGGAGGRTDWSNKTDVLDAVQKFGPALRYASPELKNDKQVVLAAVQKFGQN